MPGCSAIDCSNRTEQGYILKAFPRDPQLREIWTAKVKRLNWQPTNYSFLCEEESRSMVVCFAAGCTHRSIRDKCSFFRFPKKPRQHALWTSLCRRADAKPNKDSRLCSCHFKDGNKENGPTVFFYNEGKRFDFPNPETRCHRKALENHDDTNDIASPKGDSFTDDEKKLWKRKDMDAEVCCFLCDEYTPCNSIHNKYKRNFKKNMFTYSRRTSVNKNVDIVHDTKDETLAPSFDISETGNNSGKILLIPVKLGNSTIYKNSPSTNIATVNTYMKYHIQPKIPLPTVISSNFFSSDIAIKETQVKSEEIFSDNLQSVQEENNLHECDIQQSTIKIESEDTFLDNLQSVEEENNLDECDIEQATSKTELERTFSDNLQNVNEENKLHECDVQQSNNKIESRKTFSTNFQNVQEENNLCLSDTDVIKQGAFNFVSKSKISNVSEQVTNVTHAEAFCAAETLLRYMMNLDDVNSTDINFILNFAQKVKTRLEIKYENMSENL